MDEINLSYKDVSIIPSVLSYIEHRSECNVLVDGKHLPIFTAPMESVINVENFDYFNENGIIPILPRNISLENRFKFALDDKWAAFSLSEFETLWLGQTNIQNNAKVLIDVANGHMAKLYDLVKKSKEIYQDKIVIMIGNIANPETYKYACDAGADFIRVGIGGGEGCTTSTNTNVHYPMVSLLQAIDNIKYEYTVSNTRGNKKQKKLTKVIADGGIRNYSDINTALACGADYVMIGGMLARTLESAAKIVSNTAPIINGEQINDGYEIIKRNPNFNLADCLPCLPQKEFYGMASIRGQQAIGSAPKVPEGLVKFVTVNQTLKEFVTNARHNLQSAMSYSDSRDLDEFHRKARVIQISNNAYMSVNRLK